MEKTPKRGKSKAYQVIRSLVRRFFSDGVSRSAAALAYFLIFSFFPFLIFVSMLIGFLELPPIPVGSLRSVIPLDVINIINSFLNHVTEIKSKRLLLLGLFLTLYFTMRAVDCLIRAINKAYRVKTDGVFPWHQLLVLLYTVFLMVLIALSVCVLTFGRTLMTFLSRFIALNTESISSWNILRFVFLGVMLLFALTLLYYLVPRRRYPLRQVIPGAAASMLSWIGLSVAFSYYVENMASYSILYGSIGAVIVLLLWLYFIAVSLIMGAELNHVLLDKKADPYKPVPANRDLLKTGKE